MIGRIVFEKGYRRNVIKIERELNGFRTVEPEFMIYILECCEIGALPHGETCGIARQCHKKYKDNDNNSEENDDAITDLSNNETEQAILFKQLMIASFHLVFTEFTIFKWISKLVAAFKVLYYFSSFV